ncbi:hypothetical protein [Planotetraspora sp. GP83]|uniref:hypothetical protein n=1 Tax=Planotetraspora sp. GP83 TaxID=3156264 RepID=UPI0035117B61
MTIRAFVLVIAVLLLGTACGRADDTAQATAASPVVDDDQPVALWQMEDGFVTPGWLAIRPPHVVVYADGQVVVDAARQLRLSPSEVGDVVSALDHDLAGQPPTATPHPGAPAVADAPTTMLGVRAGGGKMREVRVPALDEIGGAYDKPLYDARDRLARLAERVTAEGQDYTADRVRLVGEDATGHTGKVRDWPKDVPVPPQSDPQSPVRTQDLSGQAANAVIRLVPHDRAQPGSWPVFADTSGARLALSWRYLLPHE